MTDLHSDGKPRLVLLNKNDLSDPAVTAPDPLKDRAWMFAKSTPLLASALKKFVPRRKSSLPPSIESQIRKGIRPRSIRRVDCRHNFNVACKSTFDQSACKAKIAATGDSSLEDKRSKVD